MSTPSPLPVPQGVSLRDLQQLSAHALDILKDAKGRTMAAMATSGQVIKEAPMLSSADLEEITGLDRRSILNLPGRGVLPDGSMRGNKRVWTLDEAMPLIREKRAPMLRPNGAAGVTITCANFKGGVAKTTTTVALAQGLSLRGHKVLVVDLDPQGSATTLFGRSPEAQDEDAPDDTAMSLFMGHEDTLAYGVRSTYWQGIDLVGANVSLFNAEFALPSRQFEGGQFYFWKVLDEGLDALRDVYDVIIIDTAPALSYTTINGLMAADIMLVPLPPSSLDFASSAQFFEMFSDLWAALVGRPGLSEAELTAAGANKRYSYINVLLSRVDGLDSSTEGVRRWIMQAYQDKVLPVEIPKSAATTTSAVGFSTIYDMLHRGMLSPRTLSRAKDAYDRLVHIMEQQIIDTWKQQLLAS